VANQVFKPLWALQGADSSRHDSGQAAATPCIDAMDQGPAKDTLTEADDALVPALLLALTVQLYEAPRVSPVTVTGLPTDSPNQRTTGLVAAVPMDPSTAWVQVAL
jgi:hypothetical protein